MNHDGSPTDPASQQSPSREYASPGSDSKPKSSSTSQKRASRAGTRSVTTLSAAQLERKRANDREAQRAIRQRTKDHIETLERRISDLTITHEGREKMMAAAQQRNRELEDENLYLRSRLGNDTFTMNVADADVKEKAADYSVSTSTSSPQPQLTGSTIPRPSSTSTSRSIPMAPLHGSQHGDTWRGHHAFPSAGVSTATPFLPEVTQSNNPPSSASWRAQEVVEPQSRLDQAGRSFATAAPSATDRSSWINSAQAYGYQVRQSDRPASYSSAPPPLSYPTHSQGPSFQTLPAPPSDPPPGSAAFHTPGLGPQGEYQQMASYGSAQQPSFHEQHPAHHSSYHVGSGQVPPPGEFHGGGAASSVRGSLAPPAFNTVAPSPHFMPAQSAHGQSLSMAYREGTAQHQYGYDA